MTFLSDMSLSELVGELEKINYGTARINRAFLANQVTRKEWNRYTERVRYVGMQVEAEIEFLKLEPKTRSVDAHTR